LRERLNGFLAVVAAPDAGRYALRAQRFLEKKNIRVVVFDDEYFGGLAWVCHGPNRGAGAATC
jgi:hypothetical protein